MIAVFVNVPWEAMGQMLSTRIILIGGLVETVVMVVTLVA